MRKPFSPVVVMDVSRPTWKIFAVAEPVLNPTIVLRAVATCDPSSVIDELPIVFVPVNFGTVPDVPLTAAFTPLAIWPNAAASVDTVPFARLVILKPPAELAAPSVKPPVSVVATGNVTFPLPLTVIHVFVFPADVPAPTSPMNEPPVASFDRK
jgi:hypothetical protein